MRHPLPRDETAHLSGRVRRRKNSERSGCQKKASDLARALLDGAYDRSAIFNLHGSGDGVHGRGGHPRRWWGIAARCSRRAVSDLATQRGRVRTRPSFPRQCNPVSDVCSFGRDPQTKCCTPSAFVETCTATRLTSSNHSRKHGARGMSFYNDTRRRGDSINTATWIPGDELVLLT